MSALLMTKLKNGLKKKGNFEFKLSNININGRKVGCSGFIINPESGVIVYVNTEKSYYYPLSCKNLVRYAKTDSDYTGLHNEFVTDDNIVKMIVSMLENKDRYEKELEVWSR